MLGTREQRGILQQALMDLFSFSEQVRDEREVSVWVSYMEIYNESVNDLLDASNSNLRIREDPSEGYYVAGLKSMRVSTIEEVHKVVVLGEKSRHYRQTDVHEHSSRSHTIFRVLLENRSKEGKKVVEDAGDADEQELHISFGTKYSVLNLVDLAGSERLSESGSHALEETQHINKSLFVLANVIYKLSDAANQHIPYRDSKLTQVLRSALGGNSLTSIICTISPNADHVNLSFSTLRFATRAKAVENKARVNEVIDDHKLLLVYKQKVVVLEKKVAQLEGIIQDSTRLNEDNQMSIAQYKLQLADLETKNSALQFEVGQLRYDCQQLSVSYDKEKQTVEVLRKVYNTAQAKEYASVDTQTAPLQITLAAT